MAEINRFYNCPVEYVTSQRNDPRYLRLIEDSWLTELDILDENGVADMLLDLPSMGYFVRDFEQEKSQNIFNLWHRPTIPWSVECEWDGYQKEKALELFELNIETDRKLL